MNDSETLLAKFFEGSLTADEAARLLEACRSNDVLRSELVALTRVHRAVAWLHHDRNTAEFENEVLLRIEPDTVESAAFVAGVVAKVRPPTIQSPPPSRPSQPWFWQKVTAIAAAIALLAGGGLYFNSLHLREDARALQAAAESAVDGSHVAVVTSLSGGGPAANNLLGVGQALPAGDFEIASGQLGLSFAAGAQLVVEGPARLSLLSPARARLWSGKAAAHVPEGAQGFTIETPSVEVVDLGTEFGVAVDASGMSDVHVFRGEVEARVAGDDTHPGSLVALNTAEGRRFYAGGPAADAVPDPASFPQPPAPSPNAPRTQGAIHFLQQPPLSVETGRLESNEFILLFQERASIDLNKETLVSFTRPGRYSASEKLRTRLSPTRAISSYLLHYDPASRGQSRLRREGSVTFATPIVGVIHKRSALNITDAALGHPAAIYDQDNSRGSERSKNAKSAKAGGDVISMSRDHRTLHVNLAVSGDLDQIRVLVKAAGEAKLSKPVSDSPPETVTK